MPDFKTEQDVEAFVASRAPGLGRLVLCLRLADGRLAGEEASLVRQWLHDRPGPGEPLLPDHLAGASAAGPATEMQENTRPEGHAALLATAAGLFGVALLVGSAWLPALR